MRRQTAKYRAGVSLARRIGESLAGAHALLYDRLRKAGYAWDPDLGRDGGWFLEAERAPKSKRPRPANVLAASAVGDLGDRVSSLERRLAKMEQQLQRVAVLAGGGR